MTAVAAFLVVVTTASADGTVAVTLDGAGSGTVASTSQESGGFGTSIATPGQIDCATGAAAPHDICSASFDFDLFGFSNDGFVTLTATPDAGHLFTGWAQSGASSSARCTTPPAGDPTCRVDLNGAPGPAATVTATFVPVPDPPAAVTGDSAPGTAGYLATLEGTVNPGGADVTECFFEYGPTAQYGRTAPCTPAAAALGSGEDEVAVSATAGPLEPNSTYHYRLVAENLGGASEGDDRALTSGAGPSDDCPNAGFRAAQGIAVQLLPDCMALEMVSPPGKFLQGARGPSWSVDGQRVLFRNLSALGDAPGQVDLSQGDQYVATRGSAGWGTQSTVTPPVDEGVLTTFWNSGLVSQSLSPDFTRWFVVGGTFEQVKAGAARAFTGGLGGLLSPLSPLLSPVDTNLDNIQTLDNFHLHDASADHSRLFFSPMTVILGSGMSTPPVRYGASDPVPAGSVPTGSMDGNVYVAGLDSAGQPSVELLARDEAGTVWGGRCGSRVGGVAPGSGGQNGRNQGAVSADGSRVVFSTRPAQTGSGECDGSTNRLRIMERVETPSGPEISQLVASECDRVAPACDSTDGDDLFQGASVDQSKVYFLSSRQLADTDLDGVGFPNGCQGFSVGGCDLYLYDSTRPEGQRLTQVSAGDETNPTPGAGAGVRDGIAAISGDGSHVYFVADGVLTTDPSPSGAVAASGQPNLYAYTRDDQHPAGKLAFIGTASTALGSGDAGLLWGALGTFKGVGAYPVPVTGKDGSGVEVGGDGHVLVFFSGGAVTADDTDSRRDVFRYDADAHELVRVSKSASGATLSETADAVARLATGTPAGTVGTAFAEIGRWVSEDGDAIAFETEDFADNPNRVFEGYLWRGDGLYSLPGSRRTDARYRSGSPTVSHDGSMVAYESFDRLVGADGDTVLDVYALRPGGGFLEPDIQDCEVLAGGCQGDGADPVDSQSSTKTAGANADPGVRVRLAVAALPARALRRASRTGVLGIGVRTNTAGRVSVLARSKIGKRIRTVGRASKQTTSAATVLLRVRLSRPVLRRLRSGRPARIELVVSQSGAHRRARTVRLPGAPS